MKEQSLIIDPSLLLEILIKANDWTKVPNLIINFDKFNKVIKDCIRHCYVGFDYAEFLYYSKRFSSYIYQVNEVELSLTRSSAEIIIKHLTWYNGISSPKDEVVKLINEIKNIDSYD